MRKNRNAKYVRRKHHNEREKRRFTAAAFPHDFSAGRTVKHKTCLTEPLSRTGVQIYFNIYVDTFDRFSAQLQILYKARVESTIYSD